MNRIAALSLMLLLTMPIAAQTKQPKGSKPTKPVGPIGSSSPKVEVPPKKAVAKAQLRRATGTMPLQVVKRRARLWKHVLFVVDTSGSMKNGNKWQHALDGVMVVLGGKSDGQEIGMITFAGSNLRWPGIADRCQHPKKVKCGSRCPRWGWASVWPDTVTAMMKWLRSNLKGGITRPGPALTAAIMEPRAQLTIIFVSDGEFDSKATIAAVKAAQKKRKKKLKLARVPILVWGAGDDAKDSASLKALAKEGRGGMWIHGKRRSGPW